MTIDSIAVEAADAEGRRRNRLEYFGRVWAAEQGVRVPRILEFREDGSHLVSERIVPGSPVGRGYIDAAFASAERIAAGRAPEMRETPSTWRHPDRWAAPRRAARLLAAGISPVLFFSSRRAVLRLPRTVPSHSDYYYNNVIVPEAEHAVSGAVTVEPAYVIDFERLQMGPAHGDVIRLITTVPQVEDAEYGLERILRTAPSRDWAAIADLLRWHSLRPWTEFVTSTIEPDFHELLRARRRWAWGRLWADDIRTTHALAVRRASARPSEATAFVAARTARAATGHAGAD